MTVWNYANPGDMDVDSHLHAAAHHKIPAILKVIVRSSNYCHRGSLRELSPWLALVWCTQATSRNHRHAFIDKHRVNIPPGIPLHRHEWDFYLSSAPGSRRFHMVLRSEYRIGMTSNSPLLGRMWPFSEWFSYANATTTELQTQNYFTIHQSLKWW